ncbi:MAG: winged helix-turn-helix domain-containing protein [Kiritimatiellia bacterium]
MKIPFALNRSSSVPLTKQLADALREAILAGHYRAGDLLPTRAEFAAELGVSERIPRAAVALLSAEGLVYTRRCLGCVVTDKTERHWLGRVLYVESHGLASYYFSALSAAFRRRMAEAGFLVSTIMCPREATGGIDVSPLADALRQQWNFVVLPFFSPALVRVMATADVDYLIAGRGASPGGRCVEMFAVEHERALRDLARTCVERGIRTVDQIGLAGTECFLDLSPYAREYGIRVRSFDVRPARTPLALDEISQASMCAFRRGLANKRFPPAGLCFFRDDYLALGGLIALLEARVRVPDELGVVTLANRGCCPPFPVSLARIEIDPYRNGEVLCAHVLRHLRRTSRRPPVAAYRFIDGASLGHVPK